jgi:hypothetical protein
MNSIHKNRIRNAKQSLVKGMPQSQILIDFVAAGVSSVLARRYLKYAKKSIEKDNLSNVIEDLNVCLSQLDYTLLDIYNALNEEPIPMGDKLKFPDTKGLLQLKKDVIKEKAVLCIKINELQSLVKDKDNIAAMNLIVSGSQSDVLKELGDLFKEKT